MNDVGLTLWEDLPDCGGLLGMIVASAPVVVWAVDRNGVFIFGKGGGMSHLGLSDDELVGMSVDDPYFDAPEIGENMRRAIAGESLTAATKIREKIIEVWYVPLRDQSGNFVGAAGLSLDATPHRQVEEGLKAERQLMEQMLRSHEREHKLVAYEIHDGLVQDATAAQLFLEAVLNRKNVPEKEMREQMELVLNLIRKSISEARQLITGLKPPILDELGIVAAIEYMAENQVDRGLCVDFKYDVQFKRLEPILESTIFRIVQEAIVNVSRHAKTDRVEISMTQVENNIQLGIKDCGIGFDPTVVKENRFGLTGIRERAKVLHGCVSIESAPGNGTRIFVELPVLFNF